MDYSQPNPLDSISLDDYQTPLDSIDLNDPFNESARKPTGTLDAYGQTITQAVKQVPGYIAASLEGSTPYDSNNLLDSVQATAKKDQEAFANGKDAQDPSFGGLATVQDIKQTAPSLAGSITGMVPTLAGAFTGARVGALAGSIGGIPGAVIGGTAGGIVGAGLGLFGMMRSAENQFVKENIDKENSNRAAQGQAPLTQQESVQFQNDLNATGDTRKMGMAEAFPETVGNLLETAVLATPIGKFGKSLSTLGHPLAKALTAGLMKGAATVATEAGEEEITRQLQNPIMQRHGFPEQTAGETLKQTAIATAPFAALGFGTGAYQSFKKPPEKVDPNNQQQTDINLDNNLDLRTDEQKAQDDTDLVNHANDRLATLNRKAEGTKDQIVTDPSTGKQVKIKGEWSRILSYDEMEERKYLIQHANNPAKLARFYTKNTAIDPANNNDNADASVIDSTAVNTTGLQGTPNSADAAYSLQPENLNGSQESTSETQNANAQEEGLLGTVASEQSGVTPNIDALAEQLHTAIATDNSKQPDQHYADIVASNKLTPQQSDDLITKYQGIAEQVNNEQTNQQTETQTQDQTGADQSTAVTFQPTQTLAESAPRPEPISKEAFNKLSEEEQNKHLGNRYNEGYGGQFTIGDKVISEEHGPGVIKTGGGRSKWVVNFDSGVEANVPDNTLDIKEVQNSYATAPLLNKRTNQPFKTRKMAEVAIASSSNPTVNQQDHIAVPVDGGFGIAPKPNTTQGNNDTATETQSVLSNTGTNAKGITAPATTDATGQGSTQTAQEVDKQPWQMTHDEYWKAEDKKYEANRLERLAKVNNELDTLKNKSEGYDAIIAKEIGKVPHTITNDGKFSHNLRSGSYKHNNAHEFVVRQLLKRRKSIESSSGRFRNSFVNDNKNHHAAIQKAIDEGQSIPNNVLDSLPSNFPEFKSDATAQATETVAPAQEFGNLSNNEQSNKESQQNTQSIMPKDSKKLGLAITRAAKIDNRSFNDMPGMYSQGSEHQGIDIHSINQTKDINGNPDYIIHVSNRTRVAANGHKTTEGKYSLNALLNSGAISQKTHDFLVNEHNQNINAATETNNDHELTATQYVDRESKGFTANKQINDSLRKAHYTAIRSHLDQGGKISQKVFDSLDGLQRSNLNKNYGEDIIQSPAQEVAKKPDWEMTRDEYKNSFDPRDYKDSNYDRMIRGAVFNEKITQAEADKKLIRDYHGNKYHWAKTRKELEQEKKEAVKNAKAARAEGNKNPIHSVKWAQKSDSNTAKNNITSTNLHHNKLLEVHQERVQEALSEGKSVPQEVLADYPDLQAPAQETANPIHDTADVSKKGENVDVTHAGQRIYQKDYKEGSRFLVETLISKQQPSANKGETTKAGTFISKNIDILINNIKFDMHSKYFKGNIIYDLTNTNKASVTDGENFYQDGKRFKLRPDGKREEIGVNFQGFNNKLMAGIADGTLSYNALAKKQYDAEQVKIDQEAKDKAVRIAKSEEENRLGNLEYADAKNIIEDNLSKAKFTNTSITIIDKDGNGSNKLDDIVIAGKEYHGLIVAKKAVPMNKGDQPWWVYASKISIEMGKPLTVLGSDTKGFATQKLAQVYAMRMADAMGGKIDSIAYKDINTALKHIEPSIGYSPMEYMRAVAYGGDPFAKVAIKKDSNLTTKGTVVADKAESNIQDFGEKLEGAKKFTYTFKEALAEDIDISAVPLSKSFPQPDYDKLIAGGIEPQVAALIAQLRAEIPTKPSKSYRVSKWVAQVTAIREAADSLLSGDLTVERFIQAGKGKDNYTKYMGDVLAIADSILPSQIRELGNFKLEHTLYGLHSGVKDVWKWSVVNTASKSSWGKQFDTKEEAIAYIKLEISTENAKGESIAKFDRWTERDKPGVVFVGKKIASGKYIALKAFSTSKEALDYTVEHNAELVELLKQKKKDKEVRRAENNQRVGKDYRNGKNVSAKEFTDTFGFRGVQFGNWVENDRRQQDLNNAYDGLIDLAEVLGIPPKALALNGELGLAFGARGTGGEKAAAAHYEANQVVINLTKAHGAGSLAHEWWHAVDNYFGKQEGSGFLSDKGPRRAQILDGNKYRASTDSDFAVRKEVFDAWQGITKAIKTETQLAKRSAIKDKTRSKDYYSTVIEMTARTFERYIIGKLADQGYENDYLANIIPAPILEKENELDNEDYAYPLQSEMAAVNKAYDKLFNTLETKETDKGTALFSKASILSDNAKPDGITESQANAAIEIFKRDFGNIDGVKFKVYKTLSDAVGETEAKKIGRVKGFYLPNSKTIAIIRDALHHVQDAAETLRHETLGHFGLNLLRPADKLAFLGDIARSKNNLFLREMFAEVVRNYPELANDEFMQAEEVFAKVAEEQPSELTQWLDKQLLKLLGLFRKIGFLKGYVTKTDMRDMAKSLAEGIRRGDSQKTFPKNNHSQFSKSAIPKLKVNLSDVTESGGHFATGVPVTFKYVHNTASYTALLGKKGKPPIDSPYGRGYEPSGQFLTVVGRHPAERRSEMEYGEVTFNNPLVIDNDSLNWKKQLSDSFGGKTGKYLSEAVIKAGYDGIVTTENGHTSEVVNLTNFDKSIAKYSKSTTPVVNPHSKTSLNQAVTKAMDTLFGQGWTNRLMATGKFKMISAAEATGLIGKNAMFHKVWHGSPHDHDKFDSAYIDTGEGAQAFGWGHYFADAKSIAEYYRDKLTSKHDAKLIIDGKVAETKVYDIKTHGYTPESTAISILAARLKYPNLRLLGFTKNGLSEAQIKEILEDTILELSPRKGENDPRYLKVNAIQIETLVALRNKKIEIGRGKLYEVDLAPNQDEYLDWDKPLSQQSDVVKAGLKELHKQLEGDQLNEYLDRINADWIELTGQELYQKILDQSHQDGLFDHPDIYDRSVPNDEASSHLLHSLGIRGIRYKAEQGQSEANNYVVFNDADVKIEVKYSKNGDVIAFYNPADDTTYLVHDNITQNTSAKALQGLMLHEIGVHALTLGKSNEVFKDILRRFEALKKTNPKVQAAFDRVPKGTKATDIVEEALAYYLEENPKSSLAQRIVEWFRQAVRALGKTLPVLERAKFSQWANKLTEAELIGMATSALKSAPDSLQFDNVGREKENIKYEQQQLDRKYLNHKQANDEIPELTAAAKQFKAGEISRDEWDAAVVKYKPVSQYTEIPALPSFDRMEAVLKGKQKTLVDWAIDNLKTGDWVRSRLDIPAYTREVEGYGGGTAVVTLHTNNSNQTAISYQSTVILDDVSFHIDNEAFAQDIATYDKGKYPLATIIGKIDNVSPEEAKKQAEAAMSDPSWVQVGMDPRRHANFYTRKDMTPVISGDRAIQVGMLILVKNPIYADRSNFKFSRSTPSNTPADNSAMRSFFAPALGKQALGWLAGLFQRNHLIDFVAQDLPELINYKLLSQEKDNFTNQRENEIGKSYKEMLDKLDKKTMHELGRVQGMATRLVKFDPALADDNTPMTEEELAVYDAYTAMPESAKEAYATMRKAYQDDLTEKKEALKERIRAFPADKETQAEIIRTIEQHFDQFKEGVYFPLNRDGSVIVKATNADGELVIEHVATQADAYKLVKEMTAQGYDNTHIIGKDAYDRDLLAGNAANEMASLAHKTISDLKEKSVQGKLTESDFNDLFSEFNQLLINTLPDSSYRKHFIHRKGTLGESTDTLRAYSKTRVSAVKMIASLTYDHQIQNVLNNADKAIKEMDKVAGSDTLAIKSIVNELKLREAALKSTEINAVSQVLTSLGFMGALGFNIGSAAVNMLQVIGVALPELIGRHGEIAAMKEIASAYKLLFNPANLDKASGLDITKNPNLSAIEKQAMKHLASIGKIDLTMTHDSIAAGKNPSYSSNPATRAFGAAAKYSGYFFHVAEAANRQITGMAAFNLAYKKNGGNFEAAIAEAVDVIDRTQFDYGQGNRARYMMSNTARVLTLFKAYALGMSYFIGRNAYQYMKGETPEVKRQARKTLVASMAMSFATAGLFGMPIGIEAFAGIGGVAAFKYKGAKFAVPGAIGGMLIFQALLAGLGADDEDELETEFRNWLTDNFDQTTAEFVTKGPARLLPIGDIAGRTSLSELWWRSQDKQLEGTDQYNAIATALLGPIGSQFAGLFTAKKMYEDGQYSRMVESMSPAFLRNAIAANRMGTEGVTNLKGDKIIQRDLTPVELINKVIGFNPTVVTNTYDANSAIAKESTKHTLAKSHLVNRWMSGDATERSDLMKGAIKDFNESVPPSERITLKSLFKSMRSRKGIDKHTKNGLYLSKKQTYLRDLGRFNRQE